MGNRVSPPDFSLQNEKKKRKKEKREDKSFSHPQN